jgi:acid phosphatase family membrane protein YuiD
MAVFKTACFWAPFSAWLIASFTKMICGLFETRRLDFSYLVKTGGLPSAHSAMVSALATAVGVRVGFGTPVFVVALAFALLTMFDASTVRRSAGLQAKLLNEIIDELFQAHHFSERKLVEFLGHTRLEVFLGMVIGILVGLIVAAFAVILESGGMA